MKRVTGIRVRMSAFMLTSNFVATKLAIAAAVRTVTFSLQAVMADIPGIAAWYAEKQDKLKKDPLARFFHNVRTESQHIGFSPLLAKELYGPLSADFKVT